MRVIDRCSLSSHRRVADRSIPIGIGMTRPLKRRHRLMAQLEMSNTAAVISSNEYNQNVAIAAAALQRKW